MDTKEKLLEEAAGKPVRRLVQVDASFGNGAGDEDEDIIIGVVVSELRASECPVRVQLMPGIQPSVAARLLRKVLDGVVNGVFARLTEVRSLTYAELLDRGGYVFSGPYAVHEDDFTYGVRSELAHVAYRREQDGTYRPLSTTEEEQELLEEIQAGNRKTVEADRAGWGIKTC